MAFHVSTWGPVGPSAPRALLLHGLSSTGATWWQIAEGLAAAGWSVTAPDLPGHGLTPRTDDLTFDAVTAALLDTVGGGFDLLVGHSLGGTLGWRLLADDDAVADRAVMLDPLLRESDAEVRDIAEGAAESARDQPRAADVVAEHPTWHPRTVAARVEAFAQGDPETLVDLMVTNLPIDVTAEAARTEVPVHVLAAADEPLFTAAMGGELVGLNPMFSWEVVPDTTHSVHRDRPEFVLGRLLHV